MLRRSPTHNACREIVSVRKPVQRSQQECIDIPQSTKLRAHRLHLHPIVDSATLSSYGNLWSPMGHPQIRFPEIAPFYAGQNDSRRFREQHIACNLSAIAFGEKDPLAK